MTVEKLFNGSMNDFRTIAANGGRVGVQATQKHRVEADIRRLTLLFFLHVGILLYACTWSNPLTVSLL